MSNTVYLKLQTFAGTDSSIDTIPLNVTSVSISVDKQIPAFPIPLSGLATGESQTSALDLGMSSKRISLSGFINETQLKRSHTPASGTATTLNFTAQEVAQLIASGVDSTGLAEFQAINELIVLIPSKINESYTEVAERNIPFTFRARGDPNALDNVSVGGSQPFPTSETSEGLKGFIQNFNFELSSESVDISFNLDFVVALILP
tara:strand:+ start:279 stop:893 length:615 start_codon:yes stop_codon:yes gene_type:complete